MFTTKEEFLNGQVLLIDKPLEWTSFDAVNAVKWAIRRRFNLKKIKVGHAGTLDPLASGLLIICTGKATKQIQEIQAQTKEYEGSMTLGATTPSYDMETEVDQEFELGAISEGELKSAAREFLGLQQQIPPIYSAIKKEGKPLYDYARAGKKVAVEGREIEIYAFEITRVKLPRVDFLVRCSKGTYIRSLASDIGKILGTGGYLKSLRRTHIGDYSVENAWALDELVEELKTNP